MLFSHPESLQDRRNIIGSQQAPWKESGFKIKNFDNGDDDDDEEEEKNLINNLSPFDDNNLRPPSSHS